MDASEEIDKKVAELPDWRGKKITDIRKIIHASDLGLKDNWKWGTPPGRATEMAWL